MDRRKQVWYNIYVGRLMKESRPVSFGGGEDLWLINEPKRGIDRKIDKEEPIFLTSCTVFMYNACR